MKQVSLGLNLSTKKTRKREFLEQMDKVVPWDVLVGVVEPHWPKSKTGRRPFAIETMLKSFWRPVELVVDAVTSRRQVPRKRVIQTIPNAITASRMKMKIKNAEEVNSITGNFAEISKKYSRTALSGIHITIESGTTHKCSSESLGSGVEIAASGYRSQCWRDGDECANDEVWGVSA